MSYTRTTKTYSYSSKGGQPKVETRTTTSRGAPVQNGSPSSAPTSAPKAAHAQPGGKKQPHPFPGQKFDDIRKKHSKDNPWEDDCFAAVDQSIFYSKRPPRPFVWKRPHEFCDNPKLFVGGASRFDVQQGELGDCWLLAAVASLTVHRQLLVKVVPEDQDLSGDKYCGAIRFNFWRFGRWIEIVVDDRLPTYFDRLVFMHSSANNEFWTALLEKAYAKLFGSYESLKGGSSAEAMEDFTGGVTEMIDLRKPPPKLFTIMKQAMARKSLMGCSIDAVPGQVEAELQSGLIAGHAYSITAVVDIDINTPRMQGKIPLVRVRNPWGNEAEWKGAWSDKSREWQLVTEEERKEHGITFSDDGEFWMSFQDFSTNFMKLEICNLDPDSLTEDQLNVGGDKKWSRTVLHGEWRKRVSAGGCRNFLDTFWTNPQFRITVTDPDEDEDDLCTVLIALMQKGRRKARIEGGDMLTCGYAVYKLKEDAGAGPMDLNFFKYNASFAKSPTFINMREICGRHQLPPGTYAVIPSTFEPLQEGEFMVRIFSESANDSAEVDEPTGVVDVEPPAELKQQVDAQEGALKESFRRVAGEDMEIDAYELQNILNLAFKKDFQFDGFSVDTARSMVAMKDIDKSGKLGFDEFKELWQDLLLWKAAFRKEDKDGSGTFNSFELRNAFSTIGIRISNATFSALVMRYAQRDGTVLFNDFIACACKLKAMFAIFNESKAGGEQASFTQKEFMLATMYS